MEKEKKYQTRTIYETLAPYDVVKALQWLDIITMREVATFQASVAKVEVDKLIETINQAIVDKIEVLSIYSI